MLTLFYFLFQLHAGSQLTYIELQVGLQLREKCAGIHAKPLFFLSLSKLHVGWQLAFVA
jgi:hypothetical protein